MKQAHFLLQTKGGVGKSFVASLLTQWMIEGKKDVVAFDNDPATASLSAYKALPIERIQLVSNDEIDQSAYDRMVERMLTFDGDFVVDNGASNFYPLVQYMGQNELFELLLENGIRPIVHTPVMAGGSLKDTAAGVDDVLNRIPEITPFVVWLNEHEGPICDGPDKPWTKFKVYEKWKDRIFAEVTIPEQRTTLFKQLLREKILGASLTFAEVEQSESFEVMERQRARMIKRQIFSQLDLVLGASAWNKAA